MQFTPRTRLALLGAVAAATLAACGGGGGSPEASALSPQSAALSPNSAAMAPQSADAADTMQLVGTPASNQPVTTLPADPDRKAPLGVRDTPKNIWIVQMADPPAATYEGTRPAPGEKLDVTSAAVRDYKAQLASKHDAVVQAVGAKRKLYSYGAVFDGFAAEMTDAQAQQAMQVKGVIAVTRDHLRQVADPTTPTFLGLTGPNGFYAKSGAKGENVVIGMVDTGIWPENPAFSDQVGGHSAYGKPKGWHGACDTGTDTTDPFPGCNNKLIGARYYNAAWGGDAGIQYYFPEEFLSPRDFAGHGSHTSSTAGGNEHTPITGKLAGYGFINGIAPRARIAMYKVCWGSEVLHQTGVLPGCADSDSVAAIEQAVADGVDVINFSISGTADDFLDPVEQAFMNAAKAGVFVAAAAGNSGPTASTVNHPSPWLTTVAAGTHNRSAVPSLVLGAASYTGATNMGPGTVSGLITTGDAAAAAGADVTLARRCYSAANNGGVPTLDPAKVAGKIVVCDRGAIAFVDKASAVYAAGGIGVVFVNVPGGSTELGPPPATVIPAMKIAVASRDAIRAYALPSNASATLSVTIKYDNPAPYTASFSSRGPSLAAQGNILKPDIMAPGVDVIAAVAPTIDNGGESFASYQGTSMATPHIAGIAALFKEAHPKWSPMAIKSALMTTAYDVLDGSGTIPAVAFRQGAGFVNPTAALDPGLVFDSDGSDWAAFLCGQYVVPRSYCKARHVKPIDASDMNTASIAVATMAGSQTVTRSVTNVSNRVSMYTASLAGLDGFDVKVTPSKLNIPPGETKSFRVTISGTGPGLDHYAAGQLTWSDGTHNVRIPVVIKPVVFAAPPEVQGTQYAVKFGYSGPFSVTLQGPVAASKQSDTIATNDIKWFTVNVPANSPFVRFDTMAADFPAGSDVDMYVFDPSGNQAGASTGPTADESVSIANPAAGTWYVAIIGFNIPSTTAVPLNLYSWVVPDAQSSFARLDAPTQAVSGKEGKVSVGLEPKSASGLYIGFATYSGATGVGGSTAIEFTQGQ